MKGCLWHRDLCLLVPIGFEDLDNRFLVSHHWVRSKKFTMEEAAPHSLFERSRVTTEDVRRRRSQAGPSDGSSVDIKAWRQQRQQLRGEISSSNAPAEVAKPPDWREAAREAQLGALHSPRTPALHSPRFPAAGDALAVEPLTPSEISMFRAQLSRAADETPPSHLAPTRELSGSSFSARSEGKDLSDLLAAEQARHSELLAAVHERTQEAIAGQQEALAKQVEQMEELRSMQQLLASRDEQLAALRLELVQLQQGEDVLRRKIVQDMSEK